MKVQRVLITGGTGFIGSRLVEVMLLTRTFEPRVFVHSTAAVARIARFPVDFKVGDLCNKKDVQTALQGCDAVVHLARGDWPVMRQGLENVLRSSVHYGVSRFVHLSSVAVYGNHPPPESVSETAPAKRMDNEYGNEKLGQEHRVLRYAKRYALPVVILRPPNVYGPFSHFALGLIQKIRAGTMAIVDGGVNPCNLVYVDNLIQAILLSLSKPAPPGQIFFVTDGEFVSWERCLTDHALLAGCSVPHIPTSDLKRTPKDRALMDSFRALPRILVSKEFRQLIEQIPLARATRHGLYRFFQSFPLETQQSIRLRLTGPVRMQMNSRSEGGYDANDNIISAQARKVAHSSEKAKQLLGYTAPISYEEGMALTAQWLRYSRII